jgi:hypothetical protein
VKLQAPSRRTLPLASPFPLFSCTSKRPFPQLLSFDPLTNAPRVYPSLPAASAPFALFPHTGARAIPLESRGYFTVPTTPGVYPPKKRSPGETRHPVQHVRPACPERQRRECAFCIPDGFAGRASRVEGPLGLPFPNTFAPHRAMHPRFDVSTFQPSNVPTSPGAHHPPPTVHYSLHLQPICRRPRIC